MTTLAPPHPQTAAQSDTLEANLAALSSRDERLALRLRDIDLSAAQAHSGRDGSPTFRIADGDDASSPRWLGRCSTPQIRAKALIERFDALGENVVVPAMGNGYEVAELLRRQPAHAAVFVVDDALFDMALALSLHDFRDALSRGRLVLFGTSGFEDALNTFLMQHVGFEFPQRMLKLPQVADDKFDEIRQAMERSARVVTLHQQETAQGLRDRINTSCTATPKTLAVISIDPRESVTTVGDALSRSAPPLAVDMTTCMPTRPEQCHTLSRLQVMVEADATIVLNSGWGTLGSLVPDGYRAASWLLPDACLMPGKTDGFKPNQEVFVATTELRDQVASLGVTHDHIHMLEPGCDEMMLDQAVATNANRDGILLVGPLYELAPQACGIVYSSHTLLWSAVCELAKQHRTDSPERLLSRAEGSCDIQLTDPQIRQTALNAIRDRVMPTLARLHAGSILQQARHAVRVVGHGWESVSGDRITRAEQPQDDRTWSSLFTAADVVIFPAWNKTDIPMLFNAMASGAHVIIAQPSYDVLEHHPQLADLFALMSTYKSGQSLRNTCDRVMKNETFRHESAEQARSIIRDRHLIRHRLATILDHFAR